MQRQWPTQATLVNSFWELQRVFWDDFPWQMRMAKVEMLGTGGLMTMLIWEPRTTTLQTQTSQDVSFSARCTI